MQMAFFILKDLNADELCISLGKSLCKPSSSEAVFDSGRSQHGYTLSKTCTSLSYSV